MKNFLSFGGGVNSVALYIYFVNNGIDFEAVFSDHGSDYPETYEYLKYFNKECVKRGWKPVTIVKGKYKDKNMKEALNLYEYCLEKKIFPSMMFRWCTEKFKIRPVHDYVNNLLEDGEKCFMNIGIAYDESHRAKEPKNPPKWMRNKIFKYPFVSDGITREDNICIIKTSGIKVPPKSGCYYCPYQKVQQFKELYKKDPELYYKAKELEINVNEKRIREMKDPLYLKNVASLEYLVQEGQIELDLEQYRVLEENKPCICGL